MSSSGGHESVLRQSEKTKALTAWKFHLSHDIGPHIFFRMFWILSATLSTFLSRYCMNECMRKRSRIPESPTKAICRGKRLRCGGCRKTRTMTTMAQFCRWVFLGVSRIFEEMLQDIHEEFVA